MENSIGSPSAGGIREEFFVDKFFKELVRKRWLFSLIGVLGGVTGFLYATMEKPVYESQFTFALDEGGADGEMSSALSIAAQFGISLGGAKDVFTGENILEIIKSRRVIETVLLSVDTFHNKPFTFAEFYLRNIAIPSGKKIPASVHYLPGESKTSFSYVKDSVLYALFLDFEKYYISASHPNKKLNIFKLKVKTPDEVFTKKFTDHLITATNDFYVEISSKKKRETLQILEQRLELTRKQVGSSISNRAAAQDANLNLAFSTPQIPLMQEQVNAQVSSAAYAEIYKNLELARFQYLKSIPLMQVIDAADYPMRRIKLSRLTAAIAVAAIFVILAIAVLFIRIVVTGRRVTH